MPQRKNNSQQLRITKTIYNKWRGANKNQNMISTCQCTNVDKLTNMTALFEYDKQKLMAKRLLSITLLKKKILSFSDISTLNIKSLYVVVKRFFSVPI